MHDPSVHKKKHEASVVDSRFYKDDFWVTRIEEIEYVRSPYYDYAK